ncbi:hypothetical protein T440DRAFT_48642 [Plenodomus tracheiphilus IPT5]|uniref:Uncharacterized protein n=1 Tax=Plenodomus tracheiphilus IPT5 TaxID=1408161 RepID=A0A6A7B9T6_9PLEO|nr:hypothetical protein T440DRAFT_48642 [Plenodomus tracheiphilus IPT5]
MGRPKQEPRRSEDMSSTTSGKGTVETGANIFSSLTTTFHFADFVATSSQASTEITSLANLIHAVRRDLTETSRLYSSPTVSNFLDAWADKRAWIESTLLDVRRALNDIGMGMDAAPQDGSESEVMTSKRKFDWAVTHQRRLLKKQQQLSACHHNLSGAMHVMQTVELCGLPGSMLQDPIFEAPARPWMPTDERNASRGPHSRQKYRVSQTNLSVSSVNLSETDKDTADSSSITSIPAELPGCIPYNTVQPETWNLSTLSNLPSPRLTKLRRSRALSSHVRSFVAPDAETPSLSAISDELSTRKASPLQRNDATTSTLTAITTPMIGRRYRACAVDVYPQPDKHRSFPSELPRLRHQSSLMKDLVSYVLPSTASETLPNKEWTSSPVLISPTLSVTACSDIPEKETSPPTRDDGDIMAREYPLQLTNNSEEFFLATQNADAPYVGMNIYAQSSLRRQIHPSYDPKLHSSHSPDKRRPSLGTTRVDRSMSLPTSPAVQFPTYSNSHPERILIYNEDVTLSKLQRVLPKEHYTEHFGASSEEATPIPTPRTDPINTAGTSVLMGVSQAQKARDIDSPELITGVEAPTTSFKTPSSSEISQGSASSFITASARSAESIHPTCSSNSTSAQAKRRAAHARRMQVAFGKADTF